MSDPEAIVLLREALALFNDHPNFSLRRDRAVTTYKLAARIELHLRLVDAQAHGRRWTHADYERAIGGMPPLTLEIFLLHRLDDLAYAEIGQRLRITVAEVERRIAEALVHMDRALTGAGHGEPANDG